MSYSRRDAQVVDGCVRLLLTGGASVFYDTLTIPPGTNWPAEIARALGDADIVVVFWSRFSARSRAVRAEYRAAIDLGKRVAPALLDGTSLPAELSSYQAIDLRAYLPRKRIPARKKHSRSAELQLWQPLGAIPSLDQRTRAVLPAAVVVKATLAARLSRGDGARDGNDPLTNADWVRRLDAFQQSLPLEGDDDDDDLPWYDKHFNWIGGGLVVLAVAAFAATPIRQWLAKRRPHLTVMRELTPLEHTLLRYARAGYCTVHGEEIGTCEDSCAIVAKFPQLSCITRPDRIFCGPRCGDRLEYNCYLSAKACQAACTTCEEKRLDVLPKPPPLPSGRLSAADVAGVRANAWCLDDRLAAVMRCDFSSQKACEDAAHPGQTCISRPASVYCGYTRASDDKVMVACHATETACRSKVAVPASCLRVDLR